MEKGQLHTTWERRSVTGIDGIAAAAPLAPVVCSSLLRLWRRFHAIECIRLHSRSHGGIECHSGGPSRVPLPYPDVFDCLLVRLTVQLQANQNPRMPTVAIDVLIHSVSDMKTGFSLPVPCQIRPVSQSKRLRYRRTNLHRALPSRYP